MKNTKQVVLNTARKLFNEVGYSRVTIRQIAQEMSISSGNLNYHFKKREEILEALYFEMVSSFDKRVEELGNQEISLAHMQKEIIDSMKRMLDYRFFWSDLYYLLQSSETIRKHFQKVREDRINGYHYVFSVLKAQDILHNDGLPVEESFLIQRMIDYSNTWIYNSFLYKHTLTEANLIQQSCFQLMSTMDSIFTDKGRAQFRSLFKEFYV